MSRLLLLTAGDLTRDPRARRQVAAGRALGFEVLGVSGSIEGDDPVPLNGIAIAPARLRLRPSPTHEAGTAGPEPGLFREARGIGRLLRLVVRTVDLARTGRAAGSVDVVHANDLDTMPAAWLLARRSSARLVYDAHELYSEFEEAPPRFARRVLLWLEARLARRADAVITVSEPLATELQRRLHLRRLPMVVLNAPALDRHDPPENANGVVYQGAFGPGRPLDDLLEALALAPSARLMIRVVRVHEKELRRAIEARGLAARVFVAEPLPPDQLADGLRGFAVGVIFDRPVTVNSRLSLPNKLFEYLMAGLAVVTPRLDALTPVVDGNRVGLTYEPGRAEALAEALERLMSDRVLLDELRANARRLALERFNAEAQAETLARAWGL